MKPQFSISRLLASALMVGIGAACIAILCRPGYDLRSTVEPFLIAAFAGFCISVGIAFLLRWSVIAWLFVGILGSAAAAFILLCILLSSAGEF